ncbi:DUF421 domain-containing protein [Vallitalea pronyensis]|uniref:DUF421 domain-containing protein n=1 Tax=Vallitalea pronyensis TaxID=1348613 RepID=A0A8J8MKS8_9FIRM|nr:DUF421 domain-containing protein [Vallitalea pronyensis]QUI23063.1 DUF421 domain-containing protein [Vallitalea pronyensis]
MNIYLTIAFRIITIMSILLVSIILIYGKRPIGELPVFDFLTILVIGSVTGADIAEPDVPHLHIIYAIIVMFAFQRLITLVYLKSDLFRKRVTFPPMVVVKDGKMIYANLKKAKISIDEILMLLREKDIFDINDVKYGILEPSGVISVLRKNFAEPVTKKDMAAPSQATAYKHSIIIDGKLQYENIAFLGSSKEEIIRLINGQGYPNVSDIFYASMDKNKTLSISPYDINQDDI